MQRKSHHRNYTKSHVRAVHQTQLYNVQAVQEIQLCRAPQNLLVDYEKSSYSLLFDVSCKNLFMSFVTRSFFIAGFWPQHITSCGCLKPNSWTHNFVEVSGHNFLSSQTWGFCIQSLNYKPVSIHFCCGGRGGGVKSVVEVTVNSKEENSKDFCPNYAQEFGLWWLVVSYSAFRFAARST